MFGVTRPIIINSAQDVATILSLNIFESELPYSNPFCTISLPNARHFCQFRPELVAMTTSFERSEKEVQIYNEIPTIW